MAARFFGCGGARGAGGGETEQGQENGPSGATHNRTSHIVFIYFFVFLLPDDNGAEDDDDDDEDGDEESVDRISDEIFVTQRRSGAQRLSR